MAVLRGSFAHTPRTIGLVWRAARAGTLGIASLTLSNAVLPLGVAYVGKRLVDAVVAQDRPDALRWVAVELVLVAVLAASSQGNALLRQIVGSKLGLGINLAILEKAIHLELRHFEDPDFYDQLTRARREASSRPLSVVTRTFQMLQSTIALLGYGALLFRFGGLAVAALLVAAVPATVAEMRFANKAFSLRNWRSPDVRKLMYLENVLASEEHAKEVKLFDLGPHFLERYRTLGERFTREDEKLTIRRGVWAYVLSLLATVTFYGCYALMAGAAALGKITLGDMTLGMVAFRQGQQAFQSLLGGFGGMYEDNLYMSNLFAYLDAAADPAGQAPSTSDSDQQPESGTAPPAGERGIRFVDVGFRYPGRTEWALRHVDVFIPAGQSLAIVGQNGAGKTTFIKLLTRLYAPSEGRIWLDGKRLQDWDEAALRTRVAVVFQDFARYQLTARENVGLGSVRALADDARIERAITQGGAAVVLDKLEQGLETPLGRRFGGGVELSGGQWQKIALARAFMREEADILVLDEPTAALDAEAEHAVFERFRELTRGRTSILISHRFPTVRMADRIIVVERGELVEEGTHEALVAKNGRYAHLFALQARGYL